MESLRELYRIGYGPSSSHTMGPRFAAERFIEHHPEGKKYKAELYGSLAATGKGHLTDKAIKQVFEKAGRPIEIEWHPEVVKPIHTNAVSIMALDDNNKVVAEKTYYSVGGGRVITENQNDLTPVDIYDSEAFGNMEKILSYCDKEGIQFWEVAIRCEGSGIMDYMAEVWKAMEEAIHNGLENEGVLPGNLKLQRRASQCYAKLDDFHGPFGGASMPLAYALAVSEENAGGGKIVTAPTCGSCGVLPSVIYCLNLDKHLSDKKIYRALLTAGLIGNIVKHNGSISGAEVGCQGEVGVACAMAGAAGTQILGGSITQIEYAAEMGLEHHLGLTCDPMGGYVQIPCIERNALAAMRAMDHSIYALMTDGRHRVSFDNAVSVMLETGHSLPSLYKETSMGGLALIK
ncbi:MAG: L-serine ammonia-lyase [Sphaerochaetaceae bacterium]|nr:L-serine ammonia-lyase [Sphaerochaetaceae bacterium]